MKHNISESVLIRKIRKAGESDSDFESLRQLIFDYYYAEDDYIFESEGLEEIFDVLSVYLESEEAYGDPLRKARMKRLHQVIRNRHRTTEDMIAALKYDRIGNLLHKFESGVISRSVFYSQFRSLSPPDPDAEKLVAAYKSLSDTEERGGPFRDRDTNPFSPGNCRADSEAAGYKRVCDLSRRGSVEKPRRKRPVVMISDKNGITGIRAGSFSDPDLKLGNYHIPDRVNGSGKTAHKNKFPT